MRAAPTLAEPPNPIDIDPYVDFTYVIASKGDTSIGFLPNDLFELELDGRALTVKFIGSLTSVAQTLPVKVFASNSGGTTTQTINFRVPAYTRATLPNFDVKTIASNDNIAFDSTTETGKRIDGRLYADRKIRFSDVHGDNAGDEAVELLDLFVKSVTAKRFQVAATVGGAAIQPGAGEAAIYDIEIAVLQDDSDRVYVGDSSLFTINEPVRIFFTGESSSLAFPTGFGAQLYVKDMPLAGYIRVSATPGGAALVADADVILKQEDSIGFYVTPVGTAGRRYPDITSDDETLVAENAPVAYTVTSDLVPDEIQVQGLPEGLQLEDDEITGTPKETGWFPVKLIAYKEGVAYTRFWQLVVGSIGVDTEVAGADADAVIDIGSRHALPFSASQGSAMDRLHAVLGDTPLRFAFQQNGDNVQLPSGAEFRFGVKPKDTFDAAEWIVFGSVSITNDAFSVVVLEDWSAEELFDQFEGANANKKYIDFLAQASWRMATDPVDRWRKTFPITMRVWNNAFREDTTSAAAVTSSPYFYWSFITRLTGGVAATDLDAQPIAALTAGTLIKVVTADEGSTEWRKELWEGAPDPVTDAAAGRIVPPDFNNATMNYVLIQK